MWRGECCSSCWCHQCCQEYHHTHSVWLTLEAVICNNDHFMLPFYCHQRMVRVHCLSSAPVWSHWFGCSGNMLAGSLPWTGHFKRTWSASWTMDRSCCMTSMARSSGSSAWERWDYLRYPLKETRHICLLYFQCMSTQNGVCMSSRVFVQYQGLGVVSHLDFVGFVLDHSFGAYRESPVFWDHSIE